MPDLKTQLRAYLERATRIAVLGVGSEIRGDDGAGVFAAELLAHDSAKWGGNRLRVFYGGTAPENLTGEIRCFRPSHLVMIDAADIGAIPGKVEIVASDSITGAMSSTHNLPLNVFVDYVRESIGCEVVVVGIQPKTLEYRAMLTPEVERSATQVANIIRELTNSAN